MANYNKSVNFAVKDTLTSGDPNKIVSGAEIDTEFNNISSASTTKIDKVPAAGTGNVAKFNATGALEDTGTPASALIPSGGVIMWSGLIASIPTGWALCDGSNGTPDLRNRFIVGAGDQYDRNDTGGADSVILAENEMPNHSHEISTDGAHSHNGTTDTEGDHDHWVNISAKSTLIGNVDTKSGTSKLTRDNSEPGLFSKTEPSGSHSHNVNLDESGSHTHTINNTGGGDSHENRPPFYALAFIMKL